MTWVLDASAILALVNDEQGSASVVAALEAGAAMSPVNLTEVSVVLQRHGWPEGHAAAFIAELNVFVPPADRAIATGAASFEPESQRVGLSLGDRYCLATAIALDATVLTADRSWSQLDASVTRASVECLR